METLASRILVVDDDARLLALLTEYLQKQGYQVATAADGAGMKEALATAKFDLIVLDVMLPDTDGLTLARSLRSAECCPIIMLSARGEEIDRIVGLEVGADDYIAKPFNPRELLARIRAVLRRCATLAPLDRNDVYRFGPFQLDATRHALTRDGAPVVLTTGEFNLLYLFVRHPNRALTRDQVIDLLKGYERTPYDRSIDIRVTRVRRKIEDDSADPKFIRTVWGVGYMFTPEG